MEGESKGRGLERDRDEGGKGMGREWSVFLFVEISGKRGVSVVKREAGRGARRSSLPAKMICNIRGLALDKGREEGTTLT